jgi:hypothetical protein
MVNFFLEGGPFILKGKSNLRMMVTEEEFLQIEEVKFSKEKVNVPAGDSECYKMEVTPDATPMLRNVPISVPDGLIKTMTQQFMPSIYRWFLVEEPHYLVKYEGFRCMGTPEKPVIAELVNIESRK